MSHVHEGDPDRLLERLKLDLEGLAQLKAVQLGAAAQLLGLVTFQLSYPVIICRARLLSIGREYEEAAMDLAV